MSVKAINIAIKDFEVDVGIRKLRIVVAFFTMISLRIFIKADLG